MLQYYYHLVTISTLTPVLVFCHCFRSNSGSFLYFRLHAAFTQTCCMFGQKTTNEKKKGFLGSTLRRFRGHMT